MTWCVLVHLFAVDYFKSEVPHLGQSKASALHDIMHWYDEFHFANASSHQLVEIQVCNSP